MAEEMISFEYPTRKALRHFLRRCEVVVHTSSGYVRGLVWGYRGLYSWDQPTVTVEFKVLERLPDRQPNPEIPNWLRSINQKAFS